MLRVPGVKRRQRVRARAERWQNIRPTLVSEQRQKPSSLLDPVSIGWAGRGQMAAATMSGIVTVQKSMRTTGDQDTLFKKVTCIVEELTKMKKEHFIHCFCHYQVACFKVTQMVTCVIVPALTLDNFCARETQNVSVVLSGEVPELLEGWRLESTSILGRYCTTHPL